MEEIHPVYSLSLEENYDKPGSWLPSQVIAFRMLELEDSYTHINLVVPGYINVSCRVS